MVSESFLSTELDIVKGRYDITIIPIGKDSVSREVDSRIRVDNSICGSSLFYKLLSFVLIFRGIIIRELVKSGEFRCMFKYPRDLIKYLYATNLVYLDIKKRIKSNPDACFYSYWFSYPPIAFAIYKSLYPKTNARFICRAHGSDVYSVDVGTYYPLRLFASKYIDKVFTVSQYGKDYLINKYSVLVNKVYVSRLGVKEPQLPSYKRNDNSITHVVSCSRMIALKRIPLIYKSIANYAQKNGSIQFKWSHLGGGPSMKDVLNEIEATAAPSNLSIELKGELKNSEILDFYKNNKIDCFILLSTSEGVPVSIMEAMSYSIPVLSTNVGGISELVIGGAGELLNVDFSQTQFNEALNRILGNLQVYKNNSLLAYKNNYDAEKNYHNFYQMALE